MVAREGESSGAGAAPVWSSRGETGADYKKSCYRQVTCSVARKQHAAWVRVHQEQGVTPNVR